MTLQKTTKNILLAAAFALLAATSAQASITIDYSTGGATISGLGNDSITLNALSGGSVTLNPNSFPVLGPLGSFTWDAVSSTPGFVSTPVTFTITVPAASQTLSLSQTFTLQSSVPIPHTGGAELQTLFISLGSTMNFTWSSGGSDFNLAVTPLAEFYGPVVATPPDPQYPGEIFGGFQLTSTPAPPDPSAVPEPSTYLAGALLLVPFGLSALRALNKKRTA
jgi:hypothetical protein